MHFLSLVSVTLLGVVGISSNWAFASDLATVEEKTKPFPWSQKLGVNPIEMEKQIDKYHETAAGDAIYQRPLRVIYFYANDSAPIDGYQQRLTDWLLDFNDFFSNEFVRNGFSPKTLALLKDENNPQWIKIDLVKGKLKAKEYGYDYKIGEAIMKEVQDALIDQYNTAEETVFIVTSLSSREENKVKLWSPFYGMGWRNQSRGTAFCVDEKDLTIENLKNQSNQKILVGEHHYATHLIADYATIYIGGALHELGHGLGLPHDLETGIERSNGISLMGAGNYTYRKSYRGKNPSSFLSMSAAVRLASHPCFLGQGANAQIMPKMNINDLKVNHLKAENKINVSGQIESDIPVYAVVFYVDPMKGNADYNAETTVATIDSEGRFNITLNTKNVQNMKWRMGIAPTFVNGACLTQDYRYDYSNK